MDSLNKSQIRWKARRGMREMDFMFDNYIDQYYDDAPIEEKKLLLELLNTEDPELFDLLLFKTTPRTPELLALIKKINPNF